MAYVPLEKLLENRQSQYRLVMAAAKRTTQLTQGAKPHLSVPSKKMTSVAMEEIAQGLVHYDELPFKSELD